jgi:tRNA-specific 2-thiouridylase
MKDKVLVAMSGGVDSSVALLKIIEMGYDAIGITMKLWEYRDVGGNLLDDSNCCSIGAIQNAKLVCDRVDVPHYTLDFTDVFQKTVVDNFTDEYLAGRTPNPCVRCNSFVKWDAFIEQADKLGAKYIATGHYANIDQDNGSVYLKKSADPMKDQTYFLWGIPPHTLSRTLFPLGGYTKKQVRAIALENQLETANTPESMEICFVADNNYKRFLKDYVPDQIDAVGTGTIIDEFGETVGSHDGYTHYTIGQRKGLGLSNPEPRYVTRIEPSLNQIVIGKKEKLLKNNCSISKTNWLVSPMDFPCEVEAQIRYNSPVVAAKIMKKNYGYEIIFKKPQSAVTPGQSIVFYLDDMVLGGGIIERNIGTEK